MPCQTTSRRVAFLGRGFTLWGILLALVLVAALTLLEQFLVRPCLQRGDGQSKVSVRHGEKLPSMGAEARLPAGLTEVAPAYLPLLDGMPKDVVEAVQRQLDVSGSEKLPVEVANSIGMHFRLIPHGDWTIGSPETENGHSPVEKCHGITLAEPFYMGVCEVTQAQWAAVMGAGENPSHFRGGERPVEEVSWTQCVAFCRKLEALEHLVKGTYCLPSEAEWEVACRAGSSAAFCFGDDVARLVEWADYHENNGRRTSPVGLLRPNAFGLHDMHGNVWEWCRDLYRNYPGDDTPQSKVHGYRCIRGGNWFVDARECRSASRSRLPDQSVGNMLGFRIMRVIRER